MNETVKNFLYDKNNPSILNEYFEDVYRVYFFYTILKKQLPVSRNKFSRDIGLLGFKTKVCKDHQGNCKRKIILPDQILTLINLSLQKNNGSGNYTNTQMRNVTASNLEKGGNILWQLKKKK